MMKACAPTARAASSISSREASGRPRAMLSATEPLNRKASWVTMTTFRRRSSVVSWRRSTPSSVRDPAETS